MIKYNFGSIIWLWVFIHKHLFFILSFFMVFKDFCCSDTILFNTLFSLSILSNLSFNDLISVMISLGSFVTLQIAVFSVGSIFLNNHFYCYWQLKLINHRAIAARFCIILGIRQFLCFCTYLLHIWIIHIWIILYGFNNFR